METPHRIAELLNESLSPHGNTIRKATEALDRLSLSPEFPFSLLSISTGNNQALKIAAATYLKNFIRRNIDGDCPSFKLSKEFKEQFMQALLQADPAVLKVLVEAFRVIVNAEFVKKDSWPELVPELRTVIQNSDLIKKDSHCQWKTINALIALQAVLRPFQYFLNPKVAKEPVPPQLEFIARQILEPLLAVFHQFVEKVLCGHGEIETEAEKVLLVTCKCMYFAMKSHMPCALPSCLPTFCGNLFRILGSLRFDGMVAPEDGHLLRLKTGKRSLLIFCTLISRHRKYSDKLLPDIINCVLNIVKYSRNVSRIDFPSERVVSLAFDVISHVLETGPGWRLVSPHFSFLLNSAIFPALVMNEKDIIEWEEDADEYIRKNLPSELEEISGWKEDSFTIRRSAINLLGVMSMSKGPSAVSMNNSSSASKRKKGENRKRTDQRFSVGELLVLPYLSKFQSPSDSGVSQIEILNDYYGVLMAYGGLQDFLKEQKSEYTKSLIRTRVLPLYTMSVCLPYLVATANWVLGELASCLPEEMSIDVYSSLLKGLEMSDTRDNSSYPVRASAAGAMMALLENDYLPPEWLPILQVVISQFGKNDEEASILFELLSSVVEAGNGNVVVHIPYIVSSLVGVISRHIPPSPEPWPQVVERGFAALEVMAQSWDNSMPKEAENDETSENWILGQVTIARSFSALLQLAWLTHSDPKEGETSPPPFIDDSPALLLSIMRSISDDTEIQELKVSELLLVWAGLIADWHAWEELEDLSIFDCIEEVVSLHKKFELKNFIEGRMPPPPAPPVPQQSIIEGIGCFVSEAILQYPSAIWRACSCVHLLLHAPSYSLQTEVKRSLVISFSRAAFSRFKEFKSKPCAMWKPLLLAVSSCYLCYPDVVEEILENDEDNGFATWASALTIICMSSFEPGLSAESEIKLTVMVLARVVERLVMKGASTNDLLRDCFTSLMEASVRLNEVQEDEDEEADDDDDDNDDDDADGDDETEDETGDDEDSEGEEREETNEEFLERYAKAAADLENGSAVEEEDVEDQNREPELGCLEVIDQQQVVWSLMEKYHQVLSQIGGLPPLVISNFLNTFPNYQLFFEAT